LDKFKSLNVEQKIVGLLYVLIKKYIFIITQIKIWIIKSKTSKP
jgi:hypothetical protein